MNLSERGILIRKTVESDLKQIYSEGREEPSFQNLPYPFNPENLAEIFASGNSILYTAVRKKKVLGFITGLLSGSESQVCWMMVKHPFRNSGIGNELLNYYTEESKKNGAEKFSIAVSRNNIGPVAFLRRAGFLEAEIILEFHKQL